MKNKVEIRIKKKDGCEDLPLPCYMSEGASGMDVYADVDGETILDPGEIKLISAGIYMSIPKGYEVQVRPRSGLAIKHGISIVNAPGTIDSDYRGLVGIILINHGKEPFAIKRADRIAQLVVQKVIQANIASVDELDETARAQGGFGHTGV
ncbi:MAG: dUTP diphosphatase [Candidatus Omnitrophica bacterium]|nr:dUTP diphosphatase [Candidatus Omnitrophota bacterium]